MKMIEKMENENRIDEFDEQESWDEKKEKKIAELNDEISKLENNKDDNIHK